MFLIQVQLGEVNLNNQSLSNVNTLGVNTGGSYQYNGYVIAEASTTLYNYFFGGAGNLTMTGNLQHRKWCAGSPRQHHRCPNTANGSNALYSNTTGSNNTANGLQALYSNTTGSYNTANGLQLSNPTPQVTKTPQMV